MSHRRYASLAEQVAHEIRDGLRSGRWQKRMPGRKSLASELGVNHKTCETALKLLEAEGVLVAQGRGRGRGIAKPSKTKSQKLRVKVLLYEKNAIRSHFLVELLYRLREAGHEAHFALKTMRELGMNTGRIARYVETVEADAWIVLAGPRDVLDWFAQRPYPAFALFGRLMHVPLASISASKVDAMRELVGRLVAMGHQRIVLVSREDRRKPTAGYFEQRFLEALEGHGIGTSSYNLPDWGDRPEELHRVLKSLFQHTPPTAMIIDEPSVFFAVMQQLARLGINAPDQISLACTDHDPNFEWCRPKITHFHWESAALIKRMMEWVHDISLGKNDRRKSSIKAKLHAGGTIGPVPK